MGTWLTGNRYVPQYQRPDHSSQPTFLKSSALCHRLVPVPTNTSLSNEQRPKQSALKADKSYWISRRLSLCPDTRTKSHRRSRALVAGVTVRYVTLCPNRRALLRDYTYYRRMSLEFSSYTHSVAILPLYRAITNS